MSTVESQGVEVKHLLHEIPTFDSPHAHNIEALEALAKSMKKSFTVIDLRKGERELVNSLKNLNVYALVAGDINVPQHITWLKNICSQAGVELLEPLFGKETSILFREMFSQSRFKATIIGVDTKYLKEEWLGFTISSETAEEFLSRTRHVDPLGENGEFHTIVVDSIAEGYHSKQDIPGEKVKSDWYVGSLCDSCGDKLWMMSWRCEECEIHLCNKCAEEIKILKNKNDLCCPMCDGILV